MAFWEGELKELGTIYNTFKGHLPDIVKELEQLIRTDDPNVVMLYSRRCLEVIVTDLCENELRRPRKTEPLKGIIDKLNAEEKVPAHIITSMLSLNSMANYGAHPKDFDPEQVKPVLNNLSIIIKWYLKYKDFKIVSKSGTDEKEKKLAEPPAKETGKAKPEKKKSWRFTIISLSVVGLVIAVSLITGIIRDKTRIISYSPENTSRDVFYDPVNMEYYSEVRIGDQVWMGENLRSEKLNDGTLIPEIKDAQDWQNADTMALCWYENMKKVYKPSPYGALYNWFAVNSGKLCPVGWHVPSDKEWKVLTAYAGDSVLYEFDIAVDGVAGKMLKEEGNDHWAYNDTVSATNKFGFTALPGGYRTIYGVFWGLGEEGFWWTSDPDPYDQEHDDAVDREMSASNDRVTDLQQYRKFGMSVRCIRD